jgi:hypothetical protein
MNLQVYSATGLNEISATRRSWIATANLQRNLLQRYAINLIELEVLVRKLQVQLVPAHCTGSFAKNGSQIALRR